MLQFVIVDPDTLEIVSRYYNDVSLFDQPWRCLRP